MLASRVVATGTPALRSFKFYVRNRAKPRSLERAMVVHCRHRLGVCAFSWDDFGLYLQKAKGPLKGLTGGHPSNQRYGSCEATPRIRLLHLFGIEAGYWRPVGEQNQGVPGIVPG